MKESSSLSVSGYAVISGRVKNSQLMQGKSISRLMLQRFLQQLSSSRRITELADVLRQQKFR